MRAVLRHRFRPEQSTCFLVLGGPTVVLGHYLPGFFALRRLMISSERLASHVVEQELVEDPREPVGLSPRRAQVQPGHVCVDIGAGLGLILIPAGNARLRLIPGYLWRFVWPTEIITLLLLGLIERSLSHL